ncbi:hypothetical protein [Kordiimonas sp.]|uniref:hypothetical protein n=1 Tax=Kordiimonas sp. TaxID=1970157 RepID=UPI003A924F0D
MPLDPLPLKSNTPDAPIITGHGSQLAKLTISLTELISRETDLLKDRKPREAHKLHGEKSRLMAEYRETLNRVRVNEHTLGPKGSPERNYLKELTDTFRAVLRDHARVVLRLKSVSEGLIRSVGEEVAKRNRPVVGYGKNAATQPAPRSRPTSLALNQVI